MKKEIDVWVDETFLEDDGRAGATVMKKPVDKSSWTKAKLIIELPEKKATITESEFDNIVSMASVVGERAFKYLNTEKQRLFGDD